MNGVFYLLYLAAYKIVLATQAAETLRKLPTGRARLIAGKTGAPASDPEAAAGNIASLGGVTDCFRLRVGDGNGADRVSFVTARAQSWSE